MVNATVFHGRRMPTVGQTTQGEAGPVRRRRPTRWWVAVVVDRAAYHSASSFRSIPSAVADEHKCWAVRRLSQETC